jgi:glycogen synthase
VTAIVADTPTAPMADTVTHSPSMHVLMVAERYLPFMDGIETHVHEVAMGLARRGVQVTILTTDPSGDLPTHEMVGDVEVRRVRAWPANRDYYLAPDIARAILSEPWDLVHCQGVHTFVSPLAMLAALRARTPYILTFHTGGHPSRLRNAIRGLQWQALSPLLVRAERLVGVSRFEARLFARALRLDTGRVAVIPNGSSLLAGLHPPCPPAPAMGSLPAGLPTVPQAGEGGAKPPLVISAGRLERYKGHHRVLAALPLLRKSWPDARLLILGAGPYEAALRAQAQSLGVADAVEIRAIPPADRAGMAETLGQAAVVTLLSEYEAHPVAVMEAVAMRRPVLVADTSGLSELAEDGIARAIPLKSSPAQVAAALLGQIQDPLVPRQVAPRTWDDTVADLLNLYQSVVRRHTPAPRSS